MRHPPTTVLALIYVLIAWYTMGMASAIAQRLQFTAYKQEDGLSSNNIDVIYQDKTGYIWVAAKGILHRFDGSTFKQYDHFRTGNLRQEIRVITEDFSDNLWVAAGGRLFRYSDQNDAFIEFAPQERNGDRDLFAYSKFIHDIHVLDSRTLLLASEKGIIQVRIDENTWNTGPLENLGVIGISEDSQGRIWAWNRWDVVVQLNSNLIEEKRFTHSEETRHTIPKSIHEVFETPDGTTWIFGSDIRYATQEDLSENRFTSLLDIDVSYSGRFVKHGIDTDGNIWIGNDQGTIFLIDYQKREIVYEQYVKAGDARGITAILIDRQGLMWIGLERNGLQKSTPVLPGVRKVDPVESAFSTRIVSKFAEDENGYIWVATDGSGLSRYDPDTDKVDCFINSANSVLDSDAIIEVFATNRGSLIVGTYPYGVYELSHNTCALKPVESLSSFRINDFYEDEHGLLWFADYEALVSYDPDTQRITRYPIPESYRSIFELHLTRWKDFIVISSWNDVSLFNVKSKKFLTNQWAYSPIPSDTTLPNELVYMSVVDAEDVLWLGTDNGLVRYNEASGTFTTFFNDAGLPGLSIKGMVFDQEGSLWLSTEQGIAQFDIHKQTTIRTFSPEDGLQAYQFTRASAFKDSKDRLYFGGHKGFNVIEPHRLNRAVHTESGLVEITAIYCLGESEDYRTDQDTQSLTGEAHRIDGLPPDIVQDSMMLRNIRFRFAHLDYFNPEKNRYLYRLIGGSDTWHATETPIVTYHALSPGFYRFEVRAINALGLPSKNTASYEFTVKPYWYETTWFYVALILTGIGCVGVIYNWRVKAINSRNEKLNQLVAKQTEEIRATNTSLAIAFEEAQVINDNLIKTNHALEHRSDQLRDSLEMNKELLGITIHDLKNPLSGIIGLAEMVIEEFREGVQATYESAIDNLPLLKYEAERMLIIIKEQLDKNDDGADSRLNKEVLILGDTISSVLRWNSKQALEKDIKIHYKANKTAIIHADIIAIQRVLDNFVSNAIKYSPPHSNVWIHVFKCKPIDDEEDTFVKVSVQDEGPGLTSEDKQKVFGKMQRLSAKPTGGEHSSGLGLYIVKQLIEAHGGHVGVDSEHGQGATFWFILPHSEQTILEQMM